MKMNLNVLVRAAMLLALTVVFQSMGRFLTPYMGQYNNFVVGPLVNACLMVAAAFTGLWGAGFIALAAPFFAIMTGAQLPLPFAPFIGIGNLVIVVIFYIFINRSKTAGIIIGSVAKFAFLYAAISVFVRMSEMKPKQKMALLFSFGWPQLVTALIGGLLAVIIIRSLKRYTTEHSVA